MMKKLLSLTFVASVISGTVYAQCTVPSPGSIPPGFYPTEQDGIADGEPNQPYAQTFTFRVPTDTTVVFQGFPVDATIDSIIFDGINGLPNGLTYDCSNADCHYDADETGCIQLSGTINDTVGNYTVTVMVTFYGTALGGTVPTEQAGSLPFANYNLKVGNVGIEDGLNMNTFDVVQNFPNPFEKETVISFSSPTHNTYKLNIYNVLGEVIKTQNIDATQGLNQFTFRSENYPAGVYVYSLSNGSKTITKRMVIR